MKNYMKPATEMLDLNGESLMIGVEQSPYGGEAYSPARMEMVPAVVDGN